MLCWWQEQTSARKVPLRTCPTPLEVNLQITSSLNHHQRCHYRSTCSCHSHIDGRRSFLGIDDKYTLLSSTSHHLHSLHRPKSLPSFKMANMGPSTIFPKSHVGFDSITSQIERKLLKRGFQFNVICVGMSSPLSCSSSSVPFTFQRVHTDRYSDRA